MTRQSFSMLQTVVGVGVLLIGLGLAAGAVSIPSVAGYGGVGLNFLRGLIVLAVLVLPRLAERWSGRVKVV